MELLNKRNLFIHYENLLKRANVALFLFPFCKCRLYPNIVTIMCVMGRKAI